MPIGSPYLSDSIPSMKGGQVVTTTTTAQLNTDYGSGNVFTPNTDFAWPYKGQILHFHKNVSKVIDASLKTALVSAGNGS